jgi:hypothetical protein
MTADSGRTTYRDSIATAMKQSTAPTARLTSVLAVSPNPVAACITLPLLKMPSTMKPTPTTVTPTAMGRAWRPIHD